MALGAVGLVALAAGYYVYVGSDPEAAEFRLAKLTRGTIQQTVSASGQLNAMVTVEVGSVISGQVSSLYVDFNSPVRAGQVIARIDPESFQVKVVQAEAELAVARAGVATKQAAVPQARANLGNGRAQLSAAEAEVARALVTEADLKLEFRRKEKLRRGGVIAASALDKARAAWQAATAALDGASAKLEAQRSNLAARQAQVRMALAEVVHARAQVAQKKAALEITKVNLGNTFIRSPVDGVVIGRDVNVGQTVAASLQAPTLFTIAQDLRKMQVETNIDEADIGQIRPGQEATFTVDSFPGRGFKGTVSQVRKKPQTVQNVVTYTVIVTADNTDLRLLPGMTANVEVRVSQRADVLKIPNAALRFQPPGMAAPKRRARAGGGGPPGGGGPGAARARLEKLAENLNLDDEQKERLRELAGQRRSRVRALMQGGGGPGPGGRETMRAMRREMNTKIMAFLNPQQREKFSRMIAGRRANPVRPGRVWILQGGRPEPVELLVGVGDGSFTEMARGRLKAGSQVIVGARRTAAGSSRRPRRYGF